MAVCALLVLAFGVPYAAADLVNDPELDIQNFGACGGATVCHGVGGTTLFNLSDLLSGALHVTYSGSGSNQTTWSLGAESGTTTGILALVNNLGGAWDGSGFSVSGPITQAGGVDWHCLSSSFVGFDGCTINGQETDPGTQVHFAVQANATLVFDWGGSMADGTQFTLGYQSPQGESLSNNVPEPGTLFLLGSGLVTAAGVWARKRRKGVPA